MPTRRRPKRPSPRLLRPPLTTAKVLAWAEDFHSRSGRWPKTTDGTVPADRNEKWLNVDMCLRLGLRGLPGGDSLARLLARERGVRNVRALPKLTESKVCRWAKAHHGRTWSWPNENSGPLPDAPGETWQNVNAALRDGDRGLPGGDALARLLARRLGARNRASAPPLTERLIRRWAKDHERRTGRPPNAWSGPVLAAPGEDWRCIDGYLRAGRRGLPGGSSLAKLLRRTPG
jgi:hypothetical protein